MANPSEDRPLLQLPNSISVTTEDPLGLVDSDSYPVEVYEALKSHLLSSFLDESQDLSSEQLVNAFVERISDLSYTIHNHPDPNLNLLKAGLLSTDDPRAIIGSIIGSANKLTTFFSSGSIRPLFQGESRVYTHVHLATLIAHQTLSTLQSPSWNDWGGVNLKSWFTDADGNTEPKISYIKTLLSWFTPGSTSPSPFQTYHFKLCTSRSVPDFTSFTGVPLIPLIVYETPIETDFPAIPGLKSTDNHTTYVISSHKLIGHGPAATQEERILASVPELLPVSIFTPPLEDTTALAVTASDPKGFTPSTLFTGHGRSAKRDESYIKDSYIDSGRPSVNSFLFLDAAELDSLDILDGSLADFTPGMLERDLWKAFMGFKGVLESHKEKMHKIISTPWGSGAFGGDIRVKLLILWVAASFAAAAAVDGTKERRLGVELAYLVKDLVLDTKEDGWDIVIGNIQESSDITALDVWRALVQLRTGKSSFIWAGLRNILQL